MNAEVSEGLWGILEGVTEKSWSTWVEMQWKLPNYINKAWRMSNPVRRVASKTESIFIEKDRLQEIQAMRYLLSQGSAEEIQKHFFPSSKSTEFNLSKLT